MEINFKTKRFGGYDKTEVLSYINDLIMSYNQKLTRYVDTINVLKAKNLELSAQLSSEQAKAKIAELEAERRQLTRRECELNQQLDETRMKLEVLADRIIELEGEKADEVKFEEQSAPVVEVKVEEKPEIETKTEEAVVQKPQPPVVSKPVKTKTAPPVRLPELPRNTVQTKKDILSALESVTL